MYVCVCVSMCVRVLTCAAVAEPGWQGAIAPPVMRSRHIGVCGGARSGGAAGREEGTLLVLLAQLAAQAGLAGRQQVQEGRVAVPRHPIRCQRAYVHTQALTYDPALHPWVKAILQKNLQRGENNKEQCISLS